MFVGDEAGMLALGRRLGRSPMTHGVIFLYGDLGAGKTTLARGILRGLGHEGSVRSPTYTLIEPYRVGEVDVYHIDLYRLGDAQELEFTGIRDCFGEPAVVLVEWPERAETLLPSPDLVVRLGHAGTGREVRLESGSPLGNRLVGYVMEGGVYRHDT